MKILGVSKLAVLALLIHSEISSAETTIKFSLGAVLRDGNGVVEGTMPVKGSEKLFLVRVSHENNKYLNTILLVNSIGNKEDHAGEVSASINVEINEEQNIVIDLPCHTNKGVHAVGLMDLHKSKNGMVIPEKAWAVDAKQKQLVPIMAESVLCEASGEG